MVKIININNSWIFVQEVCFSAPPFEGYIPIDVLSLDLNINKPNQGFVHSIKVHVQPDVSSAIVQEVNSSPVNIRRRENGWSFCTFCAGMPEGWVKDSEITYQVP